MRIVRQALLTAAILLCSPMLSAFAPLSQLQAADFSFVSEPGADSNGGRSMNGTDGGTDDVRQLIQTLSTAYQNSLMRDKPNANLEEMDLLLENASIRLSSRLLAVVTQGEVTKGEATERPCQSEERADAVQAADGMCIPDAESVALKDLTDILSRTAYRLESMERSASPANGSNEQRAVVVARIGSMEHLYRMVFAMSNIYLDQSQSAAYVQAAQRQLRLARQQMETERTLCACAPAGYTSRFQELSQLDNQLDEIQAHATTP